MHFTWVHIGVVAAIAGCLGLLGAQLVGDSQAGDGLSPAVVAAKGDSVEASASPSRDAEFASKLSTPPTHGASPDSLQVQLAVLGEQVAAERQARKRLEKELAGLAQSLSELQAGYGTGQAGGPSPSETNALSNGLLESSNADPLTTLTAAGFTPARAEQVKKRLDKFALDRLSLWDTATREGWLNSEKYQQQLKAIQTGEDGFRDDLGDTDYDRMLYALGEPNRVTVQEVMLGSASAASGIQAGDMILSYDGARVFKFEDLRGATVRGTAGELVPVTVQRGDKVESVYVPRGPLGVRLDAARVVP